MSRLPQAGDIAPDFSLVSQSGATVNLKDFVGKWVILYFYPKDNTPGCTMEARNFQLNLSKFEERNAVVLGVSFDSAESHGKFCARQNLTFQLLADTGRDVTARYGSVRNILGFKIPARNTFLINPEGKIVQVWAGVNPSRHSEELLSALASAAS